MTWSEFELCSIAHKRKVEREQLLFREVAYQVHCLNYLFGKKQPPEKDRFWPISKKQAQRTKEEKSLIKAAFIRAQEEYKAKVSG